MKTNTMMKNDDIKLKPCPFCGGEAVIQSVIKNDNLQHFYVSCSKCEIGMPMRRASLSRARVAGIWNTRYDELGREILP